MSNIKDFKTRNEIIINVGRGESGASPDEPKPKRRKGSLPGSKPNDGIFKRRQRKTGNFFDLGQKKISNIWQTVPWLLPREAFFTGPNEIPATASFNDSGGPGTHNANFTALSLSELQAYRPITKQTAPYYKLVIAAGEMTFEVTNDDSWNGDNLVIPSEFFEQPNFIIKHSVVEPLGPPALFASGILLKGVSDDPFVRPSKITNIATYGSPTVPFTPTSSDIYFLAPIPAQHIAGFNSFSDSAIVDVSAFRYRPRVDLDTPSIVVDGYGTGLESFYPIFLQACEFQSGLPDMGLWYAPDPFPSTPFQFENLMPTTAAALNAILQTRSDFEIRRFAAESYFSNSWSLDDAIVGLLIAIVKQGNQLLYVWTD